MIIDGNKIASEIQHELKQKIDVLNEKKPGLAVVLIGQNPASEIYVKRKIKACAEVGIHSELCRLPEQASEEEVLKLIDRLNHDDQLHGILVQLPLPSHLDANRISFAIAPSKDVDGIHPLNFGKLLLGEKDGFVSCTPSGIKELLKRYHVDLTGKHAVIIGRSNIVGKPMAAILMQNEPGMNATISVLNSHTANIENFCRSADVLIVAIGKANYLKAGMVKEGAVVIDVGINRVSDASPKGYRIVGDVDYEDVKPKCSLITPVPGGIGPMTIAMLLANTLKSFEQHSR